MFNFIHSTFKTLSFMKTLSQKFMAFAIMLLSVTISAFADTWTDPSTGIKWTYTVLSDGTVALGGGTSSTPAVPTSTSSVLTVPAQINGMNVTTLRKYAFYKCSKITSIIFKSIITFQSDVSFAFYQCSALTTIKGAGFNTQTATNMKSMFNGCNVLTNLDALANWDVSNVTDLSSTFKNCNSLTNISPLANWDVSNVTTMNSIFYNCVKLNSLTGLANWKTTNLKNLGLAFFQCNSALTNISPLANWDVSNVTTMNGMFQTCEKIRNINGLQNWDVSNVKSMTNMFSGCLVIPNFNVIKDWNVNSLTSMTTMFQYCKGVKNIDLSNWDVSNVTGMEFCFEGCGQLNRISLPKKGLTSLARNLFANCYALTEITIPSTVTSIDQQAFLNCYALTEITIPSKVSNIGAQAFTGCKNLTSVYCMANTPPTITNNTFYHGDVTKTLYVKTSYIDLYRNDQYWSLFNTITDIIPIVIGTGKNYATFSFDFDADFSQTEGIQPYIANKYLEGEEAAEYLSGFEAKKRLVPGLQKVANSVNPDVKLIVLARYPDGYVPSRTGEDNFDFHGVILYGQPGTYYFKMGEQDFASDSQRTVTWSTNYMKSAYESWLLNPVFKHEPNNWMEYPKDDTYNFVLKNNVFKYIDNSGTISRHKSWLELPAEKVSGTYFEASAKMVSMFDPDDSDSFATGISFIVEDEPAEIQNRYNLNGQKVDANYKGVVIVNGKKLYNK